MYLARSMSSASPEPRAICGAPIKMEILSLYVAAKEKLACEDLRAELDK